MLLVKRSSRASDCGVGGNLSRKTSLVAPDCLFVRVHRGRAGLGASLKVAVAPVPSEQGQQKRLRK